MVINKKVLLGLNKRLGFSYDGSQQDWELEFADSDRIEEFVNVLKRENLSIDEQYALMALILSSFDDRLTRNEDYNNDLWISICELLDKNQDLYKELLNYWALDNTDKDLFNITDFARKYLKERKIH